MHFSASVAICVFLNEDNEEKWVQVTFFADYETTLKKAFLNEFRIQEGMRKPTLPCAFQTFLNATNEAIN